MNLTHEDHEQMRIIRLSGELHNDQTQVLSQRVTEGFEAGVNDLVLDLARLEHIDSAGLETLLWVQDQCVNRSGQLRLSQCPDHLRTVLRMTRLYEQFQCEETQQQALHALCGV